MAQKPLYCQIPLLGTSVPVYVTFWAFLQLRASVGITGLMFMETFCGDYSPLSQWVYVWSVDPLLNQVIKTEMDMTLCFVVTRSEFPAWPGGSLRSRAFGCSESGELHHWSELESTELMTEIVYAERPLTDNNRSLASYGLKDGDVVILRQKETVEPRPSMRFPGLPRIDFSSIAVPGTSTQQQQQPPAQRPRPSPPDAPPLAQGLENPALLREMLLANPHELSLLKERNPPLAEALLSGDLEKFTRVLLEQQQDRARREQERIRLYSADPFDLEAQAKIEEDIRQQNIEENMTIAMEEAPESFGQVVMLYINCKVNGHPVKAFVDSGAQMTIMSQACAERCNIMRLVDRRWAGIAKGVGTQKIIGRVHLAQVQIEGDFLACSFSILEEQPMDMLLGLDMLKRHQCSIDLKKNVLVIGTTGSQTSFLPEGELPECARLAYGAGRDDVRPEDIADQELAEAIQKSVEEAGGTKKTRKGKTRKRKKGRKRM
ncbi:protein DDI1 homolog 2 isoform X2 [Cyanistes caeruleus]|uniref:protein DDI1 homolog 2 isoform X2 n=1 Tax=Cyanistes caeruleus TaxID=156563 RepID=UPI000CDB9C81|nr:protein DDI1 homolog 2 isoform X2 [Cyanistes caeruleus]